MRAASWTVSLSHHMLPDTQAMRELSAELTTPERVIFPVRHHSPACALQLQRLLDEVKPPVILIEGPRVFNQLIPFLAHAQAAMPLAIYTYCVERTAANVTPKRRAAYYPFCDYSPELVAIRAAQAQGCAVRFIDLDFAEQCQIEIGERDEQDSRSLLDERYLKRSRYLSALAHRLGCRDHEELWEHLFEVTAPGRPGAAFLADVYTYCKLARLDCTDDELKSDGTLLREVEMAWHIRAAVAERKTGEGPVVAVMGGFHAVAMASLLDTEVARPAISRAAFGEEWSSLIRYSFDRLDRLNGYSAGMTSPAWHQRVWLENVRHDKAGLAHGARARREVALAVLLEIADELRQRLAIALPTPTLVAAYHHTLQLAQIRNRQAPAREDVIDAVTSCFVKGDIDADGAAIMAVARRALSGHAMGKLPPGTVVPPLVRDFQYRARRQRLKIDDAEPHRSVLDIYRRAEHRVTSRLFHGLGLLGVPLATRTAGPDFFSGTGLDRLQEHWDYLHTAATEAALVELAIFGVTVPLAVANKFTSELDQLEESGQDADARRAAALLVKACVLGLHDHMPRIVGFLRRAIAADPRFESLALAAGTLGLLWESREPLEARDAKALPPLLQAVFERAIYLGCNLATLQGDGSECLAALSRLRELLVSEPGRKLDSTLYWSMVDGLFRNHAHPILRGACAGLLYSAGKLADDDLGQALAGHLNGMLLPREAVSFLRGLLSTAREAAWQQQALIATLDTLLKSWPEADFVGALPELRLAFAQMTPKETDRIALAVAARHGLADLGTLVRHDTSEGQLQAHLALSQQLEELVTAEGFHDWWSS